MGQTLIEVKRLTQNDQVRICVADLEESGDASAQEKYSHRNCLQSAQQTFAKGNHGDDSLICSLCNEQLTLAIQDKLANDDVTLNMVRSIMLHHSLVDASPEDQYEYFGLKTGMQCQLLCPLLHIAFETLCQHDFKSGGG